MKVSVVFQEGEGFVHILTLEKGDMVLRVPGLEPGSEYYLVALVYPRRWAEDFEAFMVREEITYDVVNPPMVQLCCAGGGQRELSADVLIHQPRSLVKVPGRVGLWSSDDSEYIVCPGCRSIAVLATGLSHEQLGCRALRCENCGGIVNPNPQWVDFMPLPTSD